MIKINFSLLCSLGFHDEDIKSASMNNEGDKIIVTDKNGTVIMWQKNNMLNIDKVSSWVF